jgi:hypothetical protein
LRESHIHVSRNYSGNLLPKYRVMDPRYWGLTGVTRMVPRDVSTSIRRGDRITFGHFRIWHKANIAVVSVNVRFLGRAEIEHPLLKARFFPAG